MTLSEILADITVRYPPSTAFTQANIITWLNECLIQVYSYMNAKQKDLYQFDTVADQKVYTLPSDCMLDEIISVEMADELTVTPDTTFTTYSFIELTQEMTGTHYYDGLNGLIGLYPVPDTNGYKVNIIYEKKPPLLTSGDLTASPQIDDEYHSLLTFYAIQVAAKSGNNPDVELANNYAIEYNNLWIKMTKRVMEEKVKNPTKVRHNGWW